MVCYPSGQLTDSPQVKEEWHDRIHVQVEDYLHGVISVINELVLNIYLTIMILH